MAKRAPMGAEEHVYQAVLNGDLQVDPDGTIWRVSRRGGVGRGGGVRSTTCARCRAERYPNGPGGYMQVRAMVDGVRRSAGAHRLVWRHFYGPIPAGLTINHDNGVKDDNRPGNLELATYSEQAHHARDVLARHPSLQQDGEANHRAKLTADQVAEIRRRRAAGEELVPIAADFGLAMQTISKVARGYSWQSVEFVDDLKIRELPEVAHV